jgi:hypothetical protein
VLLVSIQAATPGAGTDTLVMSVVERFGAPWVPGPAADVPEWRGLFMWKGWGPLKSPPWYPGAPPPRIVVEPGTYLAFAGAYHTPSLRTPRAHWLCLLREGEDFVYYAGPYKESREGPREWYYEHRSWDWMLGWLERRQEWLEEHYTQGPLAKVRWCVRHGAAFRPKGDHLELLKALDAAYHADPSKGY